MSNSETGSGGWVAATPSLASARWDRFSLRDDQQENYGSPQETEWKDVQEDDSFYETNDLKYQNRFLTDEELDDYLPQDGYEIITPPAGYDHLEEVRQPEAVPEFIPIENISNPDVPDVRADEAAAFGVLLRWQRLGGEPQDPYELAQFRAQRVLIQLKAGEARLHRIAMRELPEIQPAAFFEQLKELWGFLTSERERAILIRAMDRMLLNCKGELEGSALDAALHVVQPLLTDPDRLARQQGRHVASMLVRTTSTLSLLRALRPDIADPRIQIRIMASRILAIALQYSDISSESAIALVRELAISRVWMVRQAGVRVLKELAELPGASGAAKLIRETSSQTLNILGECLRNDDVPAVRQAAAGAVAALVDAVAPLGSAQFLTLLEPLVGEWRRAADRGGSLRHVGGAAVLVRAIAALAGLVPSESGSQQLQVFMEVLQRHIGAQEDEIRRAALSLLRAIVEHRSCDAALAHKCGDFLFEQYWRGVSQATQRRECKAVIRAVKSLAAKCNNTEVFASLLATGTPPGSLALDAMCQLLQSSTSSIGVPEALRIQLINTVLATLESPQNDPATAIAAARLTGPLFEKVINATDNSDNFLEKLPLLLSHTEPTTRRQAAEAASNTASSLGGKLRPFALSALGQLVHEPNPMVLGAFIRSIEAILRASPPGKSSDSPSLAQTLVEVKRVLGNPAAEVQDASARLVALIAEQARDYPDAATRQLRVNLYNTATTQLLGLLRAKHKSTRQITAEAFGLVADAITPAPIVKHLLNNLSRAEDRRLRICTEMALTSVARYCQPFCVVPFLLQEYTAVSGSEAAETIQQAILKTLRFMLETLGSTAAPYVESLVPLLHAALTERQIPTRRMAIEVMRNAFIALADNGSVRSPAIALHLLQLAHPSLIPTTTGTEQQRLTSALADAIDAARLVVSPGILLSFLIQGLYHPARFVRASYWRMYNVLLRSAGPDALVPFYPLELLDTPHPVRDALL